MSELSIAVPCQIQSPNTKQELKLGGIVPIKHYFLINQMSCVDQQANHSLRQQHDNITLKLPNLQCLQINIHKMTIEFLAKYWVLGERRIRRFHSQYFRSFTWRRWENHGFTATFRCWTVFICHHPMAYFCVQLRAVASYLALSVLYMWAISGTSGSSGLGSVKREHMDSST